MTDHQFDLIAILAIIKKNSKRLLWLSLGAAILTAIIYLIKPKQYEGKTEFYIANPLYQDRSNIFKKDVAIAIPYFGDENTVDKVMTMAKSDGVIDAVAAKLNLYQHYKLDAQKPKEVNDLRLAFRAKREVKRTEYYTVEVSYKDKNPQMAAAVANEIVNETNKLFTEFFESIKTNATKGLQSKIVQLDSSIASLTDTLSALRNTYGIYDIISPNRETIINSSINGRGNVGYGMEVIQNVSAIKDELVKDRARYTAIVNEYNATGNAHEMLMLHPIYQALPPVKPAGLGLLLTALAAGLAVFFFALLYFLLSHYFNAAEQRA